MIELREHSAGIIVPVRAQPGARRNAIEGVHAGMLKVRVTQPPDKGKANQAIIELLAARLGIAKQQIQLLSGQTSRQKQFLIQGVSLETVRALAGSDVA